MSSPAIFREIIRPPFWLALFIYAMLFSLVAAIWAAFTNQITLAAAIAALLGGALILIKMKEEITIDANELRIGAAHIERKYLGEVTLLPRAEFLKARTRDIDPAAHLALIFWVSEGLRISVVDSRDPTPYWLISTRKGAELKKILEGER